MNKTFTELFCEKKFQAHEQWMKDNLIYECIMGSHSYGCNHDDSDFDILGIVMPKVEVVYPQQFGYILNFDQVPNFEMKECKGKGNRITLEDGRESEGEWRSIINFFYLAGIKGSPTLIESLFVRQNFVKYINTVGSLIRDNRQMFLSQNTYWAFRGYSFQQLSRMRRNVVSGKAETPERQILLDTVGYDSKMGYHCLRLVDQLDQLIKTGTLDLMRAKEECKVMRAGQWGDWKKFEEHINNKLIYLDKQLETSRLSSKPQSGSLHTLLTDILEQYYGSESKMKQTEYISVKDIKEQLDRIELSINKKA